MLEGTVIFGAFSNSAMWGSHFLPSENVCEFQRQLIQNWKLNSGQGVTVILSGWYDLGSGMLSQAEYTVCPEASEGHMVPHKLQPLSRVYFLSAWHFLVENNSKTWGHFL